MLANQNDFYMGQALLRYGEYGELESQLLMQLVDRPGLVIEAGANTGTHTVPLARRAAGFGSELIAFEPQPVIFQNLCANVALNGLLNVRAWPWACGAQGGKLFFPPPDYLDTGNFGAVSMQAFAAEGLIEVPCIRLDDVIADRPVSLIKIDIEGFELQALQGAVRTLATSRPTLYVENDRVAQSSELIGWLWSQGYRLWWHIPHLYNPENYFGNEENIYGNVASINMLALPNESKIHVQGFMEITDQDHHPLRQAE
jgi:FkbM family methyltransferase